MQSFGPQTHRWEFFNGNLPQNTVYADAAYAVIRAEYNNDWVIGKYSTQYRKAYIPYGGQELEVPGSFEILTHAPGTHVKWVPAAHGQVHNGGVGPVGKEGVFVGRAVCPNPENKYTPGKIHPTYKKFFLPWGGRENEYTNYEALVIEFDHHHPHPQPHPQPTSQLYQWQHFSHGHLPQNAVYADPAYAVIRANHNGDWVIGKYSTQYHKSYIPYGGQEVEVHGQVEALTHAPGAQVKWIPASNGQVHNGGVGPVGKENLFVGRAVCPHPENKYTPGKIHQNYKKFYLPWGGKENEYTNYEALVIEPGFQQPSFQPQPGFQQVTIQPGFVQPGFPQPGFQQPGFQQPGFNVTIQQQPTFQQQPQQPYQWVSLNVGHLPQNAVYSDPSYAVIRANYGGDWVIGKYSTQYHKAYVPWGGNEVEVPGQVEVLTHAPGSTVQWVPSSHGQIPQGAVGPVGKENLYVGRAVCPHPENKHTPGKIHPGYKKFYLPWGGKENEYTNYETLVILAGFGQPGFQQPGFQQPSFQPQPGFQQPGFQQQGFQPQPYQWVHMNFGQLPPNTVFADPAYAVVKANHNGDWVIGKYSTQYHKAYIPYGGKEIEVNGQIEVLTHAPGTNVQWVNASHGHVPNGAVGPVGKENLFVGRAVCPHPENKYTPGKIHQGYKKLYLPWGGKENEYHDYQALVITSGW